MWCFNARRQMIGAMEDGHRPETPKALWAHLEKCENCAREMKRCRNLTAQLRSIPHAVAPEELWPSIAREVFRIPPLGAGESLPAYHLLPGRSFPVAAMTSVAVVILIAAVISFYPFRFFSPQLVSAELDLSSYISRSTPGSHETWLRAAEGFQPVAIDAFHRTHPFEIYHPEVVADQFTLRSIRVRRIGSHEAAQLTYSNGVEGLSIFEVSKDVKLSFGAMDSSECELSSRHCRKMRTADCVLTFTAGGTQFVLCTRNHDMKFLAQVVREFTERYSTP